MLSTETKLRSLSQPKLKALMIECGVTVTEICDEINAKPRDVYCVTASHTGGRLANFYKVLAEKIPAAAIEAA